MWASSRDLMGKQAGNDIEISMVQQGQTRWGGVTWCDVVNTSFQFFGENWNVSVDSSMLSNSSLKA